MKNKIVSPTALTFLFGLVISLTITWVYEQNNQQILKKIFLEDSARITNDIKDQITLYQYGLRGVRGMIQTHIESEMNRNIFKAYSDTRDVAFEFPGAAGFGFIRRISEKQDAIYIQNMREKNWPDFSIRQLSPQTGEHYIIEYIEPISTNKAAIGLDIRSETNRRIAAEASMKKGKPYLTGPIKLVQKEGKVKQSFLFLLPIYKTPKIPSTEPERIESLVGWSYAALSMDDILSTININSKTTQLLISDITETTVSPDFFDSSQYKNTSKAFYNQTELIEVFGRKWQLNFIAHPSFVHAQHLFKTIWILLIGLTLNILSTIGIYFWLKYRRQKIQSVKEKMKLASIVESSADAIISKTLNGVVTSWNKGAQTLFGYSDKDAIGKTITDLIVPNDLKSEELTLLHSIRKGESIEHFQTKRKKNNGEIIDVSVTVSPIFDEGKNIIGASKTIRDISKLKEAEQQIINANYSLEKQVFERTESLEMARATLRTVLDAVPSMIGYWDSNLTNQVANRAYAAWFDLEPQDLPGKPMRELVGEILYQQNLPYVKAALQGEPQTFERSVQKPNSSKLMHALAHYLPDIVDGAVRGFYVIIHDVTKITEQSLHLRKAIRENQALLDTINQRMLYSATGVDGKIISVNENFCRTAGCSKEEIIGKHHNDINGYQHSPEYWNSVLETIKSGKTWQGEVFNKPIKGTLGWFDTVIAPFFDDQGNVERFISIMTDITEKKLTEMEIQRVNALLYNVLNAASEIAIIATDCEGMISIFNVGAERMLGYSTEEIVNKFTPALFHDAEEVVARGEELSTEYGTTIEGFRAFIYLTELGGSESREWTYITKTGERLTVNLVVTAIRNESGLITGYLGMANDITKQKITQRQLLSTKDQLAKAAAVANLGVWTWDIYTNALSWNDQMFEIYDYPKSLSDNGLNYMHWLSRVHEDDAEIAKNKLMDAIETRGIYDIEYRVRDTKGNIKIVRAEGHIEVDAKGKPLRVIGINIDMTMQRAAELELRTAKDTADAANAAKSTFLANMSHEIRTPMNAVLGMLQLVQRTQLNEHQQDYIKKAKIAAKSLLQLLNDILDFSKIDAGKMILDTHPFDLEELLHELGIVISGNHGTSNVEVMFDVDGKLPVMVVGDQLRLQQILINLAGNALKFTKVGHVIIGLKLMASQLNSVCIRISVNDTGIGISPNQLNHIFSSFTQAEASTTRKYGGTGLGLVISRRLIELMGSTLHVHSEIDRGSCFSFDITFPTINPKNISERNTLPISSMKVLVVDDNQFINEILVRMIDDIGWRSESANNGYNAIDMAQEAALKNEPFDVILMDWKMPECDGLTASQEIRKLFKGSEQPIIIITSAFGDALQTSLSIPNKPFDGFLAKPISPNQFFTAVEKILAGNPAEILEYSAPQKPLKGVRLLVVEDNALNRQVAAELLRITGAQVDLAEGGLEGVAKVLDDHNTFDIILMDIQMPDIDGLEASRRIRADSRFKALPILAMTANASPADREDCIAAGMNEHIAKPIDLDELVPKILALLNGSTIEKKLLDDDSIDTNETAIEKYSSILKRFGNNHKVYRSFLGNFLTEGNKLIETLTESNRITDNKQAGAIMHSLKGLALNMGAKALAAYASDLESELKTNAINHHATIINENTIKELKSLLITGNQLLFNEINSDDSPPADSNVDNPSLNQDEILSKLNEILILLKDNNLDAIPKMESCFALLTEPDKKRYSMLNNSVVTLEFSSAIEVLESILLELPS